jgi:hypothetical protein
VILRGGFIGVDVFVVISGYRIFSIICEQLRSGHASLVRFCKRHVRRITAKAFRSDNFRGTDRRPAVPDAVAHGARQMLRRWCNA